MNKTLPKRRKTDFLVKLKHQQHLHSHQPGPSHRTATSLSDSKTKLGDKPGVEVSEEATVVMGACQEDNTVSLGPPEVLQQGAPKVHLKEEVRQGEEHFKKTPFAFTVTKNTTSRKSVELE